MTEDVNTIDMEEFWMRRSNAEQNAYIQKLTPEEKEILIQRRDAWEEVQLAAIAKAEAEEAQRGSYKLFAVQNICQVIAEYDQLLLHLQASAWLRKNVQGKLDRGQPLRPNEKDVQERYALTAASGMGDVFNHRAVAEMQHQRRDLEENQAAISPCLHQDIVDKVNAFITREMPHVRVNLEALVERARLHATPETYKDILSLRPQISKENGKLLRDRIMALVEEKFASDPAAFDPVHWTQLKERSGQDIADGVAKRLSQKEKAAKI